MMRLAKALVAAAVACLFLTACQITGGGRAHAMAAAIAEFQKRGGSGDVECEAFYTGSRWRVTIWVDPQKPGGYVIVEVSPSGKILGYSPGY